MKSVVLMLLLVMPLLGCATDNGADNNGPPLKNPDPLIKVNRVTHKFNHVFDKILLKPAAKVYRFLIPKFFRNRVSHFFSNLSDVNSSLNAFLQGKPKEGFRDIGRLAINSTFGIGGMFDPATSMGLQQQQEDFGQTFAVWGIPRGPYIELPFLGPSTVEDAFGRPFDSYVYPVRYLYPVAHRNVLYGLDVLDTRVKLLPLDATVFGDEYIFYRDAYLQRRNYLINDGKVKDTFDDF